MPLSTSGLNCAISLGREGPGSCFTPIGLLSSDVKTCHQFGYGEGPGCCFTPTGLRSVKPCHQFGKIMAGELLFHTKSLLIIVLNCAISLGK
jgi:hypothetical protein